IAHRGARAFAPENTLEAVAAAARFACHMVELDVHLSRDGELIVVHDDDLVRCSNVREVFPERAPWFVSDFTAKEIAKLDAGRWYVAELNKPPTERASYLRDITEEERSLRQPRCPGPVCRRWRPDADPARGADTGSPTR